MDELYIDPTPFGEECAQVGSDDYSTRARKECQAFINQLKREFGDPPPNTELRIGTNPHDFGTYYDIRLRYDENDPDSVKWAFSVEGNLPEYWDEQAKKELNGE